MDIEIAKRIYVLLRDQRYGKCNGQFYFEMLMMYGVNLAKATNGRELPDKWFCDMAIWFPQYNELVGIELKEWAKPVSPMVIDDHYEAYSRVFDKFYLAAPKFSKKTVEKYLNSHVGLIVMDEEYRLSGYPQTNRVFSNAHTDFLRRLDNNWHKRYKRLMQKYGDVFMPAEPVEIVPQQQLKL